MKETFNTRISSVNRKAADEFNHKSHAQDGVHFLLDTNPAPTAKYSGFVVLTDTVITSITEQTLGSITGDITAVTFTAGYYPLSFSTITLTSGSLMLIKEI